ncbi:MAG TPA: glutathione transferase GstA, partial [Usitatibacter sp.]
LSPHIVAREAGVELELDKIDGKNKKTADGIDFYKVNPKGYVPALEISPGDVLTEGPAIVQYIADQKPASNLIAPAGSPQRYRMQEMLGYINSEIHKAYSPLFSASTPPETVEDRKAHLKKRYRFIEDKLAGHDYLFGDHFTVADAYLFTVTNWAHHVKFDLSEFPNLVAFQKRVAARPAVQQAMREEGLIA